MLSCYIEINPLMANLKRSIAYILILASYLLCLFAVCEDKKKIIIFIY